MATTDPVPSVRALQLRPDTHATRFVELHTDLVYRQFDDGRPLTGGRQLRFDLLRPHVSRPTPLVLFIKGGGFRNVYKSLRIPQLMGLAEAGVAVASIEYRTSNECAFPGQLHDVKAAVRYFRAHAERFNLDPSAFAAWGNSAGGTMATLLGATNLDPAHEGNGEHLEFSSHVSAVADWYGVTDAASMPESERGNSPMSLLLGEPAVRGSEAVANFTPSRYIGTDTPPMLIVHGDQDAVVPYRQSELLATVLAKRSLEFEFYRVVGAGHSFEQLSTRTDALRITQNFLLTHLEGQLGTFREREGPAGVS